MKLSKIFLLTALTIYFFNSCDKTDPKIDHASFYSILIQAQSLGGFPNQTINCTAKLVNEQGVEQVASLTWVVENEQIADVDANGQIKLKAVGNTILEARAIVDNQIITAQKRIEVHSLDVLTLLPQEINTYPNSTDIPIKIYHADHIKVIPSYESSDPSIASVSQDGLIHINAVGSCEIRVIVTNLAGGPSKSIPITVNPHLNMNAVANIIISCPASYLYLNQEMQCTAKAYNSYGLEIPSTFNWSIDQPLNASVDASGKLTAQLVGTITVQASAAGVQCTAVINIPSSCAHLISSGTPYIPSPTIQNAPSTIHIYRGERLSLDPCVEGKGSSSCIPIPGCSNNTRVAEIQGNVIVANAPGVATLTYVWNSYLHAVVTVYVH